MQRQDARTHVGSTRKIRLATPVDALELVAVVASLSGRLGKPR